MTAYRFVTLTCDNCGEIHDGGASVTFREIRRDAAVTAGWTLRWNQNRTRADWCGLCSGTHERTDYGIVPKQVPS
jgi:hypothetical protein